MGAVVGRGEILDQEGGEYFGLMARMRSIRLRQVPAILRFTPAGARRTVRRGPHASAPAGLMQATAPALRAIGCRLSSFEERRSVA